MARLIIQNLAMGLNRDRGEAGAFEDLVALHEPRVRRLAHRLLGWREGGEVDDVVQDVFLAALKRIDSFRGDANVATWLTTITLNRCRTHRRRELLRLRWLRRRAAETTHQPAVDGTPDADETSQRVRAAVAQLAAKDREVIVLFHLEELPIAEIARLWGISRGAVEVRLHRARRRLKEKLGDLMGD